MGAAGLSSGAEVNSRLCYVRSFGCRESSAHQKLCALIQLAGTKQALPAMKSRTRRLVSKTAISGVALRS